MFKLAAVTLSFFDVAHWVRRAYSSAEVHRMDGATCLIMGRSALEWPRDPEELTANNKKPATPKGSGPVTRDTRRL
jgi:hypothetical protein